MLSSVGLKLIHLDYSAEERCEHNLQYSEFGCRLTSIIIIFIWPVQLYTLILLAVVPGLQTCHIQCMSNVEVLHLELRCHDAENIIAIKKIIQGFC